MINIFKYLVCKNNSHIFQRVAKRQLNYEKSIKHQELVRKRIQEEIRSEKHRGIQNS